jgi:transcriptional regulator with XRE-family HTH domain
MLSKNNTIKEMELFESGWEFLTDKQIAREIGKRLRAHRLRINMTQQQVAHHCGIARQSVMKAENGGGVSLEIVIKIFRALNRIGDLEHAIQPPPFSPVQRYRQQTKPQRKRASGTPAGD